MAHIKAQRGPYYMAVMSSLKHMVMGPEEFNLTNSGNLTCSFIELSIDPTSWIGPSNQKQNTSISLLIL